MISEHYVYPNILACGTKVERSLRKMLKEDYIQMLKKVEDSPIISEHDDVFCPITLSLFTEPYITLCSHTFNKKELIRALGINGKCPLCRRVVAIEDLKIDHEMLKTIASLVKAAEICESQLNETIS